MVADASAGVDVVARGDWVADASEGVGEVLRDGLVSGGSAAAVATAGASIMVS